jgi:hypothetical protein
MGRMAAMTSGGVAEQIELIDSGWRRLRDAIGRLGGSRMEVTTSAGWTVKEMVAHVAFWEETVNPVVNGMYRGKEVPLEEWYGGDDLSLAPGEPWPIADVHNAREAAWARTRSPEEVLARWDRAHERLLVVVRTITAEEAHRDEYFRKIRAATYDHYAEHLFELEGGEPK